MFGKKMPGYGRGGFGEKLLLFYLAGVLLGIVLLQFPDKEFIYRFGFFSESTMERLKYMEVDGKGLFFYCLKNRGLLAALLVVFALTNLAPAAAAVFMGWLGVGTGAWLTAASIRYGIVGPVLYLGVIMPQALCYVPAFLMYMQWMSDIYDRQANYGGNLIGTGKIFGKMAQMLVIFALFLMGIFMESYVNPILLKKIIKFFL